MFHVKQPRSLDQHLYGGQDDGLRTATARRRSQRNAPSGTPLITPVDDFRSL
jgi:hypothetical protein